MRESGRQWQSSGGDIVGHQRREDRRTQGGDQDRKLSDVLLSAGRAGQTSPGQGCQLGTNHCLGRKDRSTMSVWQKRREVRAASAIARQLVRTSPGGLAVRDRGIGSTEPDLLISISTNGRSKEGSNALFENVKRRARRAGLTKRHCWTTGVRMGEALNPGPSQLDNDLRKPLDGDSDGFESISEASRLSSDDEKDREEDSVALGGDNDEFEQISESSEEEDEFEGLHVPADLTETEATSNHQLRIMAVNPDGMKNIDETFELAKRKESICSA